MANPVVEKELRDLAFEKDHKVQMMFYPPAWVAASHSSHGWEIEKFPPTPPANLPESPGVYAFVVQTNLFDFGYSCGLFYIGKATSLRSRMANYVSEIGVELKDTKRPKIWKMVNLWEDHLNLYYTTTATVEDAEALETEMIEAFRPPFNVRHTAATSKKMRAFG